MSRSRNPFIVRREIRYREPFCNRDHEIQVFLESAVSDEAICLMSPRRYGKSSLINQVFGKLAERDWITVRLDMMVIRTLPALIEAIDQKCLDASTKWKRFKSQARQAASRIRPQFGVDANDSTPTMTFNLSPKAKEDGMITSALKTIATLPEKINRPVCFAIDEFQEVANLDKTNRLIGIIRAVFQKRSRGFLPIYLGSRRHMLEAMFEDESAPFYRSARILELKELEAFAFADFMVQQFRQTTGRKLPEGIGAATAIIFGGHPHAMNVVASRLWTFCELAEDLTEKRIIDAWKNIIQELIVEERSYYQESNRKISRSTMDVLANIACQGVVAEPFSREFARLCQTTPSRIQSALQSLLKEDKLILLSAGYVVLDPLEALCLKTEKVDSKTIGIELDRLLARSVRKRLKYT